jgi:hypothetical protein
MYKREWEKVGEALEARMNCWCAMIQLPIEIAALNVV